MKMSVVSQNFITTVSDGKETKWKTKNHQMEEERKASFVPVHVLQAELITDMK